MVNSPSYLGSSHPNQQPFPSAQNSSQVFMASLPPLHNQQPLTSAQNNSQAFLAQSPPLPNQQPLNSTHQNSQVFMAPSPPLPTQQPLTSAQHNSQAFMAPPSNLYNFHVARAMCPPTYHDQFLQACMTSQNPQTFMTYLHGNYPSMMQASNPSQSSNAYMTSSNSVSGTSGKSKHTCDDDNEQTSPHKSKRFKRAGHILWDPTHDELLIPFLAGQVRKGMKSDKSLRRPAFCAASSYINNEFGTNYSPENVQNHMKSLRTRYLDYLKCIDISGAGWDEETYTVTVDSETMVNPRLRDYVNKPLKHYEELKLIFGDDFATGSFRRCVYEEGERSQSKVPTDITEDDDTTILVTQVESQKFEGQKTRKLPRESTSSKSRGGRRRSKQVLADDNELEFVRASIDQIAIALKKANMGWIDSLAEKVMEFKGRYPNWFLDKAIAKLYASEMEGKLFVVQSDEARVGWLDNFAKENGVVQNDVGGLTGGNAP